MGDISTNKHCSDDAVRGWREGRRGMKEGEGDWGERLTGEKRKRAFMCKRLCCMDGYMLSSSHFFLY